MPNIDTIVVPDAAGTPVNHTFTKLKTEGDTAFFAEQSNANALGYWSLALTHRGPLAGQAEKVFRDKIQLAIPTVATETINGIGRPSLLYTQRFSAETINPADTTLQNRKDLRKVAVGIMNDASFVAMSETLQNIT